MTDINVLVVEDEPLIAEAHAQYVGVDLVPPRQAEEDRRLGVAIADRVQKGAEHGNAVRRTGEGAVQGVCGAEEPQANTGREEPALDYQEANARGQRGADHRQRVWRQTEATEKPRRRFRVYA